VRRENATTASIRSLPSIRACRAGARHHVGAGGLAADDDDGSWTRGLFKPSQESADARAPALPDFARGA
jgi:hypothetical protein